MVKSRSLDGYTLNRLHANGTVVKFRSFDGCTLARLNANGTVDVNVPGRGVFRHVSRTEVNSQGGRGAYSQGGRANSQGGRKPSQTV